MPLDPMPDWVHARRRQIGERLRDARHHASLTQLQLGERIGRDHRTIHRWEYAVRIPDLNDLLLIADALDVPLSELVRDPPPVQENPGGGPHGRPPRGS